MMLDPLAQALMRTHRAMATPKLIGSLLPVPVPGTLWDASPNHKMRVAAHRARIRRRYGNLTSSPSIRLILRTVAAFYGVSQLAMLSHRRTPILVHARQVAMYLARELTEFSFPQIGRGMGHRDHSTILYGAGKIASLMQDDERLADEIEILRMKIEGDNHGDAD